MNRLCCVDVRVIDQSHLHRYSFVLGLVCDSWMADYVLLLSDFEKNQAVDRD